MIKVLRFWLDLGVDGFRFDVINYLTVNEDLVSNNPYDEKGEQIHKFDKGQNGVLDIIKKLAKDIKNIKKDAFLVGEVGSEDLGELIDYSGKDLLDVVFNFNLGSIENFSTEKIYKEIIEMNNRYSEDQIPTIFFNSHDMERSISRFNPNGDKDGIERAMAALLLTSYGVPFMYFGEEIGMKNLFCKEISKMNDIQGVTKYNIEINNGKSEKEALESANKSSRDKSRSPMQWDNSKYYGFSQVEPWINIDDKKDIETVEMFESNENSLLKIYRKLIKLRYDNQCLLYGRYNNVCLEDDIISFERKLNDEVIKVIINFSENIYEEDINGNILYSLSKEVDKISLAPYEFAIIKC